MQKLYPLIDFFCRRPNKIPNSRSENGYSFTEREFVIDKVLTIM